MKFHHTAIVRRRLSIPARLLRKRVRAAKRSLDFGCGRSLDARILRMERYDPYGYPTYPKGKFDCILCSYVLNVVCQEEETRILDQLLQLLQRGGTAYVTVRRDKETTLRQRIVVLPLIKYKETRTYCIYELRKS